MKKSTIGIIALEILLVIVTVGYNYFGIGAPKNIEYVVQKELKSGEYASTNYILKYKMPEGYVEILESPDEIAINKATETGLASFSSDIIYKSMVTAEDFIKLQEEKFSQSGEFNIISEDKIEEGDKIINKKIFQVTTPFGDIYNFIGTIDFVSDENQFIAIIGNSIFTGNPEEVDIFLEDVKADFDTFITTLNYTKQTLNSERTFSKDLQDIEISIPDNWKKLGKIKPYNFIRQDDTNVSYAVIDTISKQVISPQEYLEGTVASFIDQGAKLVEENKVENIGDKTITTSTIDYELSPQTTRFITMEFENSNLFVFIIFDTNKELLDTINSDFDFIINSIKLK